MADEPDLTRATTYVEADAVDQPERSIAKGRWHLTPGDVVWFERDSGEITRATAIASGDALQAMVDRGSLVKVDR